MAEQIIDIRERIEKMRIKFADDHKSDIYDVSNDEKKVIKIKRFEANILRWETKIKRANTYLKKYKTKLKRLSK